LVQLDSAFQYDQRMAKYPFDAALAVNAR